MNNQNGTNSSEKISEKTLENISEKILDNGQEGYQTLNKKWKIEDGAGNQKIVRDFKLSDFMSALKLANKIGEVAEKIGHHPEMVVGWGKLRVETTTHDGGNVLSHKDFELAMAIDQIGEVRQKGEI